MANPNPADPAASDPAASGPAAPDQARRSTIVAVAVAVLALVAVVAIVVVPKLTGGPKTAAPPNANDALTGIIANPDAPAAHVMTIYQDYQCSACAQADAVLGPVVRQAVESGTIRVEYRTMTFLDRSNSAGETAESSTRAANAAACADDAGRFFEYQEYLMTNQAAEGGGFSEEFLRVTAAAGAGITGGDLTRFQSCYDDRKYSDFVTGVYGAATQAGITGTPTYQLDGQLVTLYSAESLQADIDSVLAGGAPAANPACSPSDHPDAPPTTLPPNANAKATGIVANPEAPADHVLAVYVDFQCPYCAQAEELSGDVVAEAVAENKVRVEFRTRTFLDQVNQSNTDGTADSSTRAANAAACADLAGVYLPYHKYIFDNQPTEGVGYTDGFLRDVAPAAVGLSGDALATFQQCYDSRQFAEFVSYVDTAAQYACVTGTPTYKLDGEDVSWSDPASLKKSLDAVS